MTSMIPLAQVMELADHIRHFAGANMGIHDLGDTVVWNEKKNNRYGLTKPIPVLPVRKRHSCVKRAECTIIDKCNVDLVSIENSQTHCGNSVIPYPP